MPNNVSTAIDTTPFWSEVKTPKLERLDRNQHVDVVVVGGGITGLTAGYLLATSGKSVSVLERNRIGDIDTGHTSAHVTYVTDTTLSELSKRHGRQHAQAVWDAGLAALARIESIVREQAIECAFDWIDGYLHQPGDANADQGVDFEREATLAASSASMRNSSRPVPLAGGPGVRFGYQARFHPRELSRRPGRARIAEGRRPASTSTAKPTTSAEPAQRDRRSATDLTCDDIVLATHDPLVGVSRTDERDTVADEAGAVFELCRGRPCARRGCIPDALFWDTADPYHYLRLEPHRDYDVVIFGGEDHKTGQVADTNVVLRAAGADAAHDGSRRRAHASLVRTGDRDARRSAVHRRRRPMHQYAATGFSGNGMTFGTLSA